MSLGNGHTGISAMIRCALWCEVQLDLEILFMGRYGLDRYECILETAGKHLAYFVILDGGFIFLKAQVLDGLADPDELFSIGDTKDGWHTICKIIQALERNEVKSLARPIEAGPGGPDSYLIA